jgi:hypothetical protein
MIFYTVVDRYDGDYGLLRLFLQHYDLYVYGLLIQWCSTAMFFYNYSLLRLRRTTVKIICNFDFLGSSTAMVVYGSGLLWPLLFLRVHILYGYGPIQLRCITTSKGSRLILLRYYLTLSKINFNYFVWFPYLCTTFHNNVCWKTCSPQHVCKFVIHMNVGRSPFLLFKKI